MSDQASVTVTPSSVLVETQVEGCHLLGILDMPGRMRKTPPELSTGT